MTRADLTRAILLQEDLTDETLLTRPMLATLASAQDWCMCAVLRAQRPMRAPVANSPCAGSRYDENSFHALYNVK